METGTIRGALICADDEFRAAVTEVLRRSTAVSLIFDPRASITQLADGQMRELREANPELVILDLDPDPALGIKFAQFLSEQSPGRRILATGPTLSADQLLSALRAGISEYLPRPAGREHLSVALDGLIRKLRWSPTASPSQPGKLFAVFSGKGGSGSTTVATNLAIYLHQLTGKRALLVDLDLELGEIALQLGAEPRFNFIDMVRNFHRMDTDLLASFIEHHPSGVHLLSAPYHPQKTEVVTGDQITRILQFLKQHYEYVIVDTSKSFSPPTLATFEQADVIYLVTTVDLPSLRNIARCLPLLKQMTAAPEERLRLILNRFQPDSVIRVPDIERSLGLKVFRTISNDYEAVMRSINSGTPIILDTDSRFAEDLRGLGAEVAGLQAPSDDSPLRRSLMEPLSRMWRKTFQRDPEIKA